jgi:hypothetical protein
MDVTVLLELKELRDHQVLWDQQDLLVLNLLKSKVTT